MPKNAAQIGELLGANQAVMRTEFMRLSMLDRKIKGKLTRTWMPSTADAEYRDLFRKASGPWLEFTRDAIAQGVVCDGYSNDEVWQKAWQANGMQGRQNGIVREVVGLGKSYVLVTPGSVVEEIEQTGDDGLPLVGLDNLPVLSQREVADRSTVVMRPLSALQTYAYFADPWSEFPTWVLTRIGPTKPTNFWTSRWLFVDNQAMYWFEGNTNNPSVDTVRTFEHGLDYCPVAQISNTLPAIGEPESSVERAIPIYERIVDATFALEMAQRYASFPQKWMSGGSIASGPANADGTPGKPAANIAVDSLLQSTDPETRFGNFANGSLADVVVAVDAHIKHLAAVCQVPPHYLLGAVVNMSAEGIAAAESGYFRNIGERQDSMSEGFQLSMRVAADILEVTVDAATDEMHFEDVSSRSLAQISDAILKLATLKTPLDKLFQFIPGFTQRDAIDAAASATKAQDDASQRQLDIAAAAGTPLAVPKELTLNPVDSNAGTATPQVVAPKAPVTAIPGA